MNEYTYWDVNEETSIRFSDKNCAKFMKALLKSKGIITSAILWGNDNYKDASRSFNVRIGFPNLYPGMKEKFELLSGFTLTKPEQVQFASDCSEE